MPDKASESLLRKVPIFADLNDELLGLILESLQWQHFPPGTDIFVQGEPADGMLLLVSGAAVLFRTEPDGSQEPLASITSQQHLNHEALFKDSIQSATLRAAQSVTLAKLTRAAFSELAQQHEQLRSALGIKGKSRGPAVNPRFAEQREDEEILIQTHRHWWSFVRTAWLPLLLMAGLWGAALLLEAQAISLLLIASSFVLPGFALIYFYAEWRNDSLIVTDQRIIRIERTILAMHRQITQVGLDSVQEINFDIPSYDPFARLFRYGTVIIKTAGSQGNLELDLIPKPQQFQKLIIEDRQYFENRKAQRHHDIVRAELQRWMAGDTSELDDEFNRASAEPQSAPQPLKGANGYLSTRITMSNGDIVYRKHISVWAQHTFLPMMIVLGAAAALLLTFTLLSPDFRIVTFPVAMVALLLGSVSYYWLDWDWRNDIYIISDDVITLVRKRPFFLQNLRDQILVERVDNVESVTTGFFAAIMKYGDVRMSLVGADEHKLFHRVSDPQEIQQEISRRQHNKALRRAKYDAMQQRQILGEYLGAAQAQAAQQLPAQPATVHGSPSATPVSNGKETGQAHVLPAHQVRAATNLDRNRPARLPRKRVNYGDMPARTDIGPAQDTGRARPSRFGSDKDKV